MAILAHYPARNMEVSVTNIVQTSGNRKVCFIHTLDRSEPFPCYTHGGWIERDWTTVPPDFLTNVRFDGRITPEDRARFAQLSPDRQPALPCAHASTALDSTGGRGIRGGEHYDDEKITLVCKDCGEELPEPKAKALESSIYDDLFQDDLEHAWEQYERDYGDREDNQLP